MKYILWKFEVIEMIGWILCKRLNKIYKSRIEGNIYEYRKKEKKRENIDRYYVEI